MVTQWCHSVNDELGIIIINVAELQLNLIWADGKTRHQWMLVHVGARHSLLGVIVCLVWHFVCRGGMWSYNWIIRHVKWLTLDHAISYVIKFFSVRHLEIIDCACWHPFDAIFVYLDFVCAEWSEPVYFANCLCEAQHAWSMVKLMLKGHEFSVQ